MSDFLELDGRLEYIKEPKSNIEKYVLDLSEIKDFSIGGVYKFFEDFIATIRQRNTVDIQVLCGNHPKKEAAALFASFVSILSKSVTEDLKDGEKRLSPRTEIMDTTDMDVVTIKRFLNYKSKGIKYLRIQLIRKGKSIMAL